MARGGRGGSESRVPGVSLGVNVVNVVNFLLGRRQISDRFTKTTPPWDPLSLPPRDDHVPPQTSPRRALSVPARRSARSTRRWTLPCDRKSATGLLRPICETLRDHERS